MIQMDAEIQQKIKAFIHTEKMHAEKAGIRRYERHEK